MAGLLGYNRPMNEETIFTKIINGDIPSHKIYEDERTYAFLDIHPLTPGHTLVVPKNPVPYIWDLPAEEYQALMATAQKLGGHLKETLHTPYVSMQVVGVDVPHAHVHLIPFSTTEELRREPSSDEPNHDALAAMAQKLAL